MESRLPHPPTPEIISHHPQPPLAQFVAVMWLQDTSFPEPTFESILPTGCLTLSINLTYRQATFGGAYTQPFRLERSRLPRHVGVHFKPGGAFPFLPCPTGELRNRLVSLDELWGEAVFSLRDRLLAAQTPQQIFQLCEAFLLERLKRPFSRHPAVSYALQTWSHHPTLPLTNLTNQLGYSPRYFRQLFDDQVGLTPKRFSRVRRFQHLLAQLTSGKAPDWGRHARRCGYFDQAHLTHEFRALSGLTPSAYWQHGPAEKNHIRL